MNATPQTASDVCPRVDLYAVALRALLGEALRADPELVERAARRLDGQPSGLGYQAAAQLLRNDLATFTENRTA
jgi:hypothetical protein